MGVTGDSGVLGEEIWCAHALGSNLGRLNSGSMRGYAAAGTGWGWRITEGSAIACDCDAGLDIAGGIECCTG